MLRNRIILTCLVTLLALAAGSAMALVEPEAGPLNAKSFQAPELHIGTYYLSEAQLASRAQASPFGSLSALGVRPGAGYLDPRSGRWGTLMPSAPLVPGRGNQLEAVSKAPVAVAARDAFLGWLGDHAAELGIDMDEVATPKVTVHRGGELVQLHAPRIAGGIPVRDSYLHAVINHGNLVLFGAVNWGDVNASPVPVMGHESARGVVANHLGDQAGAVDWQKRQLVYVPAANGADPRTVAIGEGYRYHLAWAFWGKSRHGQGDWEALVDAHDGALLAFRDLLNYAEADPAKGVITATTREVEGGVLPVTNDGSDPGGIEHTYPIPFTFIDNGGDTYLTDSGGNVQACLDGTIESNLDGPYITINDSCGTTSESTTGDTLDFGTNAGTDCATPPGASDGNTRSARSGFYELNRLMEIGRSYLPDNQFLESNIFVTMNIDLNCNANSGGSVLNFYTSGGGCANTGEIAGVFDHEWGHSMDGGDATPGVSSPGEGIADIYAALRLNTSCIGHNFRPGLPCGGYGNACNTCTGVRDIDWAAHSLNTPFTMTQTDACAPPVQGSIGPCGGSVHCEGQVYSQSVWDLWKRELPMAPFSMSDTTAQTLATRLTFEGSGGVGAWFTCVPGTGTGDGCNANGGYLNYLAADDDDGDLGNGTPHMDAIFNAFDAHGIACGTPTVTTAGCADTPTAQSTVMATATDRGAVVTWTAVTDAVEYQVYRTEGEFACSFGKKLVTTTSDLTYVDAELKNGNDYYYTVVPVGAGGETCVGPASACTTVTPVAGPNLAALGSSVGFNVTSGDGDSFIDSCENATVTFDVDNIGSGAMTNARIDDVRSPSHPGLEPTITNFGVFAASLDPCETAQASFDFQALSIEYGDTLTFEVDITGDELAGLVRTATLNITRLESDFQTVASVLFDFEGGDREGWTTTSGTFDPSAAVGGAGASLAAMNSSTLLDSQCDRVSSPIFKPQATTAMVIRTNYEIEDFSGQWWDRANVSTIDGSGVRTVRTPSSGRAYDTTSPDAYGGCNTGEHGWAGTTSGNTWAQSTFSAAALGSAALAGQEVQIEVVYGTDGAAVERGFAFDRLSLTNVDLQVEDAQPNCEGATIFEDGFESGNTSAWSTTVN